MTSPFDEVIDRVGTHSAKWDKMEDIYGVSPEDGLAMWVADMDFRPPACVQEALQGMLDHGVYGYFGDESDYLAAIRWWMAERHGWAVEDDWITTTHGLVNGAALCIDAYTAPGDGLNADERALYKQQAVVLLYMLICGSALMLHGGGD